ncbi:maleylpyruvate isomerase family mycothiol-dependent enzyme [Streptomyces sp. SID13031]|uniref:maleylpyruvate isomerase family mycothiol-dependent enzyme n=1 Tax=Streptomyces sp. SID13031 TaxID=2706046 RepID=UPI0013C83220|nr:maleylpyruvate isomerase family mycothiol-dependent enzyme [Streptomyces sp. SID13031]NEA32659.1 maleylpyruvate isomerase family mycothiol-dependent enzyme [Streptomyces sp. SID13031]
MTEIRQLIAAERHDLATLLKELPATQWDAPTLCEGWRVREVVAHVTMPYRYSTPRILLELFRSRGRFNPMADRLARRDTAELSPTELTECLAANVHHPWKPPGGGFEGALSHDVIHGLDITVALGIDRTVPPERLGIVLGGLSDKHLKYFGVDLTGTQLRATDLDWSYGTGGKVITGRAQDLLLKVCGRVVP